MAFASVPHRDFRFLEGADKVRRFASSGFGHRLFCGECGTPLAMAVDDQPETIDFSIATLDAPGAIAPAFHIFWSSRIAWFDPGDSRPRHDRFRPDTGGIAGTEPPQ